MRNHYWTCSKFADWLRGTTKGGAKTAEGWDEWEKRAKSSHPIRWWLAEEGLDYIQTVVYWPVDRLYDVKYYINNRWVTRTHALTANARDIRPGTWCDVGYRFLPCLFNELQDFVEVELAWWQIAWDDEAKAKYKAPFWAKGWFRWRTWRCPEAGLDNLKKRAAYRWEEGEVSDPSLVGKPTYEAERMKEVLDLYLWWTQVYRNRPDPHDASGWTEYCELRRVESGETGMGFLAESKNPETRALGTTALAKTDEIEKAYEAEDTEMMIRLVKIRGALWT